METYQVKIPRGVHEGQRIRLAGQGEAGAGGGKSGDLFLRVRLARHPDFSVEGNDLIYEAKLEPWQAALGTEIGVPTLEGKRHLKISAGHPSAGSDFGCAIAGCPPPAALGAISSSSSRFQIPKKLSEAERRNSGTDRRRLHRPKRVTFLLETGYGIDRGASRLEQREMKISLGSDHAGFRYKEKIKELLVSAWARG